MSFSNLNSGFYWIRAWRKVKRILPSLFYKSDRSLISEEYSRPSRKQFLTPLFTTMKKSFLFTILLLIRQSAIADTWTQIADFGGAGRWNAVAFSIDGKGYVGTGASTVDSYSNDLWEYDPNTNAWTQKADLHDGRRFAVGFSIGSKGYIGTGQISSYDFLNDFWEYDPVLNLWMQKADFPGGKRFAAVGFSIGSKGYLGTGDNGTPKKDFWEYDPLSDTWSQIADYAGNRYGAVSFNIGSKGYVGTGSDAQMPYNDFWEYNSSTNLWTQKASFGGDPREAAIGFSIGAQGYIGLGDDFYLPYKYDFWEYNSLTDVWTQKANYGGWKTDYAIGFSINTQGYVGLGDDSTLSSLRKDFWQYTPDTILPLGLGTASFATSFEVFPNPFTSFATISFSLDESAQTTVSIFDLAGRKIKTLIDEDLAAGDYHKLLNCESIGAGVYLLNVKTNGETFTKKISIE